MGLLRRQCAIFGCRTLRCRSRWPTARPTASDEPSAASTAATIALPATAKDTALYTTNASHASHVSRTSHTQFTVRRYVTALHTLGDYPVLSAGPDTG